MGRIDGLFTRENGPGYCLLRATTPGLSSMGGGSLLKPAGKQVLYQIGNLYRVLVPAGRMRQARPQQAKVYKEVKNDLTAAVLRTI